MVKPNQSDAFKMQFIMLKLSGSWPEMHSTFSYKIRGVSLFSTTVLLGLTMFIEVFNDITDFAKLSEILYIMVLVTTYVIKHLVFFAKRNTFIGIMQILDEPLLKSYPDDLDIYLAKGIKVSKYVTGSFGYLVLICASLMALSPVFDGRFIPFPFSFDLIKEVRYPMWIFQGIAIMVVGWNNPCLDSLAASLMCISASQLRILGNKITRISNDSENIIHDLRICIRYHLTIVELIRSTDETFSFCILTQFLGSVIIICNTLFHFVLVEIGSMQFFVLANYLMAVLLQLFMYSWFGTEVIWMSLKIGEACYFSRWYDCKYNIGKDLFIMMERSKRPLKVTIFKFSVLSLGSFTTIIQWSYSYFALLFKLYSQRTD